MTEFAAPAPKDHPLRQFVHDFVYGYGSFLFFTRASANLLLIACTMMRPWVGAMGMVGGISTLLWRRWLALDSVAYGLEVTNGVLAGLLIGYFFAPHWLTAVLAVAAGPLALLVSAALGGALRKHSLPLMSGSFVIVGVLLLAVGRAMLLPFGIPSPPPPIEWIPWPLSDFLKALGGVYLTRTEAGGAFVLAALALSSRTLVLLAVLAATVAEVILFAFHIPAGELAGSSAISAAVMTAIMTGGLFTTPSGRAMVVALFASACATLVSLALFNSFYYLMIPPLSLPFLVTTWLVMYTLRGERGTAWARYWTFPSLPERNLQRTRQAESRGFSAHSVALRAPFYGTWDVSQTFDGPHTHQRPWGHALDFHQMVDGLAHKGDGSELSDYYCFGQPVLAPLSGRVVAVRNDVRDNRPGDVEIVDNWGNYVMIALPWGDYIQIAHLVCGSATVKVGDDVRLGQVIGRCGNTGRSPRPHLHLQVQTGPLLSSPTRPFHLSGVCVKSHGRPWFSLNTVPGENDRVTNPVTSEALKRCLHLPMGQRLTYQASLASGQKRDHVLEVDLDPLNQFRLVAESGATVLLAETDNVLAVFERNGPHDPVLSAFALAIGYVPLTDAELEWRDSPPTFLLPLPLGWRAFSWLLPALFQVDAHYRREWDAKSLAWHHAGRHRLLLLGRPVWACETTATVHEGTGITAFSLSVGGRPFLDAWLSQVGLKPEIGVPGWDVPLPPPARRETVGG